MVYENIQIGMVRAFFFNALDLPRPTDLSLLAPKNPANLQISELADKEALMVPKEWVGFF